MGAYTYIGLYLILEREIIKNAPEIIIFSTLILNQAQRLVFSSYFMCVYECVCVCMCVCVCVRVCVCVCVCV